MDKNHLSKSLNKPAVPDNLVSTIRTNWNTQLKLENTRKHYTISGVIVAGFLVMTLTVFQFNKTPTFIEAAWNDIQLNEKHDIGISVSLDNYLIEKLMRSAIKNELINRAKVCNIDKSNTIHMKVADNNEFPLHLFIKEGEFSIYPWQTLKGKNSDMRWQVITPQQNISVLVIHAPNVNSNKVDALIEKIFFG